MNAAQGFNGTGTKCERRHAKTLTILSCGVFSDTLSGVALQNIQKINK